MTDARPEAPRLTPQLERAAREAANHPELGDPYGLAPLLAEVDALRAALATQQQEKETAQANALDLLDRLTKQNAAFDRQVAANEAAESALTQRTEERDEARRFGEDAARQYNELLEAYNRVTCAFCGEEFPRGTPRHGDGLLAEHMRTCVQHPLADAQQRIARLEQALRDWITFTEQAERPINGCISISAVHGCPYDGPNWNDVLAESKAALAASPTGTPQT